MKRWPEWALFVSGAVFLSTGAWSIAKYTSFQSHPEWFAKSPAKFVPGRRITPASLSNPADRAICGRLTIPRLRLSVLIVEGDDDAALSLAAGHLPGTAALGALGNAVVAGHRDMTFRPLRKIKLGDTIKVRVRATTYKYIVQSVRIVNPEDISVLQNGKEQRLLTLITCYPFRYLGDAPKRYVVCAKMKGI